MQIGFKYAAIAGISFGKDDLIIPSDKNDLLNTTQLKVQEYEDQYQDGLITQGEKYNKVVDAWSECTNRVADKMLDVISSLKLHLTSYQQLYWYTLTKHQLLYYTFLLE